MSNEQNDHQCPVCDSQEIEGESIDVDEGTVSQEMSCRTCEWTWENIYVFSHVSSLMPPEEAVPPPSSKLETMSELVKRYLNVARDNGFCYDMLTQVFGPVELLRTNLVFTGDLDLTYDEIFKCIQEAKSILMKEERPNA